VRLFGDSRTAARVAPIAALLLLPLCLTDLVQARAAVDFRNEFNRGAEEVIRAAPPRSIVFVRYPAGHNPHRAVTRNEADLPSARTWVVYDRGRDNARLLALAPGRAPYRFDAATFRLEPGQ
jgi:hypothetical protein